MPAVTSRSMPCGASWSASRMDSLDTKPNNGGIAAIDAAAMTVEANVNGIWL